MITFSTLMYFNCDTWYSTNTLNIAVNYNGNL